MVEGTGMQSRVGEGPEHVRQQVGQQFPAEGGFAEAQGRIGEGDAREHEDMMGEGSPAPARAC